MLCELSVPTGWDKVDVECSWPSEYPKESYMENMGVDMVFKGPETWS